MLCSLTEGDTEIPCCVSKENSKPQHSPYSPSKSTISSPSGMYPCSSNLELQFSPPVKRLLQISAFPARGAESRAHRSVCYCRRQSRTFQQPFTNLPPLPPSSASIQGWWLLPWPGEDQAAQGHYLLQPVWLVFCHSLDATGRVGNFGAPCKPKGWLPARGQKAAQI